MKKRITPTKWIADSYDCVFPFGKYKGYKVRYVIDNEPSYILWLDEQDIVKFTDEMIDEAEENDDAQHDPYEDEYYWFLDD